MVLRYLCGLVLLILAIPGSAGAEPFPPRDPRFISLSENGLQAGGLPQLPYLEPIDEARAAAFFAQVRAEGMENRYIIGSCDDRAHFISLLATRAGIRVGKVWAVAPARYMLLSKSLLSVADPTGIAAGDVTWGYHVAPVLRIQSGGEERTVVLDRSLSPDNYLPVTEWANRVGNANALFFFTTAQDFTFSSLDSMEIKDPHTGSTETVKLPQWMPNLLTGDFTAYSAGKHRQWVASGLARDQLALYVHTGQIGAVSPQERTALTEAIRSESGLKLLASGELAGISSGVRDRAKNYYD